jgi:hypothetical protein
MGERVDKTGAAFAGSQLQTQIWVNRRPDRLSRLVCDAFADLPGASISWVSPTRPDGYREYQDQAFLRRVRLERLSGDLAVFWPAGGPVRDSLGIVADSKETGVVLLEGKSYPRELYGSGCQAGPTSRTKILSAFAATQDWLGVVRSPEAWCGPLYQTANRLAHLYWLNQVVRTRAWFVHLLFTADPRSPTTPEEWETAIATADAELGLTRVGPRARHLILKGGHRDELIAPDPLIGNAVELRERKRPT